MITAKHFSRQPSLLIDKKNSIWDNLDGNKNLSEGEQL